MAALLLWGAPPQHFFPRSTHSPFSKGQRGPSVPTVLPSWIRIFLPLPSKEPRKPGPGGTAVKGQEFVPCLLQPWDFFSLCARLACPDFPALGLRWLPQILSLWRHGEKFACFPRHTHNLLYLYPSLHLFHLSVSSLEQLPSSLPLSEMQGQNRNRNRNHSHARSWQTAMSAI